MRDVAYRAEVDPATVSRVLNGGKFVSSEKRGRVLTAAKELGYETDLVAQSLRRGRTLTIGCVVSDITNPVIADMVRAAEAELQAAGYAMLLTDSSGEARQDIDHIRQLRQRRIDGLLLMTAEDAREETARALSGGFPTVSIDRDYVDIESVSSVYCDHRKGMREAMEHLISLGHRKIALIIGSRSVRSIRERIAGYEDALVAGGLKVDPSLIRSGPIGHDYAFSQTVDLVKRSRPSAIIAGANQLLGGVLDALVDHGLRLGKDVSLVSFDDTELTRLFSPAISVVARDPRTIGRTAAQMLLERIAGPVSRTVATAPTWYIPRKSVGKPPPSVTRAPRITKH